MDTTARVAIFAELLRERKLTFSWRVHNELIKFTTIPNSLIFPTVIPFHKDKANPDGPGYKVSILFGEDQQQLQDFDTELAKRWKLCDDK